MFERMLDHPNITVELETDALNRLELADGVIKLDGEAFDGPVIYTGQADELFGFQFGPLPYRTLDFGFETCRRTFTRPTAPSTIPWTNPIPASPSSNTSPARRSPAPPPS